MATWVTHLMIADSVMKCFPELHRRGFCVGNIAPDCNVENEDWTVFTPSREVTHWMQGERKQISDCDAFYNQYIYNRKNCLQSAEEYSFFLGYYGHLLTDAAFQAMTRNPARVENVWRRIKADNTLCTESKGMPETWDSAKKLIPKREWMKGIASLEAKYLSEHKDSGYFTEILPLKEFPDYIDYLPHGAIPRKIRVMGYLPVCEATQRAFIALSQQEYESFLYSTIQLVISRFQERNLV